MQYTIFFLTVLLTVIPAFILGIVFYNQYSKIITEKVSRLNMSNTLQIGANIEGILRNVQNNSLVLYQDGTVRKYLLEEENLKNLTQLDNVIRNKIAYEEFVSEIDIKRMDGKQYSSNSETAGIDNEIGEKLMLLKGKPFFNTSVASGPKKDKKIMFGYGRVINDIYGNNTPIGILQLYIKKNTILKMFENIQMAKSNEFYIVEQGKVIVSSDDKYQGLNIDEVIGKIPLNEKQYSQNTEIKGEKRLLTYYELKYPNWVLINMVSMDQIYSEKIVVGQSILVTILLGIVISSVLAMILSKWVIKPLKVISKSMRNIEEENFKIKIPEEGYRELSSLAHSFNNMSEKLDELVNKIYAVQIKEKDAQIRAMQAYISPHFLYNTLDTICWMSRMENAYETCNLIEALSKLFRLSVKDTSKTTTVKTELEHIENYIMIQECRHFGNIEFVMRVDETLLSCETVRFVLQPLLENAIIHGIEPKGEFGKVVIEIKKDKNNLVFMIANEGEDVNTKELENLLKNDSAENKGLGLRNVNDRIQLHFGETYGIKFEKNIPNGLIVIVVQPLLKRGDIDYDNSDDCR